MTDTLAAPARTTMAACRPCGVYAEAIEAGLPCLEIECTRKMKRCDGYICPVNGCEKFFTSQVKYRRHMKRGIHGDY